MQFVGVIFLALAFSFSVGVKIDDANRYMDQVLSVSLPAAIEAAGLNVYKMPDFTIKKQEKTSDGATLNTKIFYYAGNLTGLQNTVRDSCEEPTESSGNITVLCHIVLPYLEADYAGRFQSIKGFNNPFGVHVRQFDFNLDIDAHLVKVELEVTSSTSIQIPALKKLSLKYRGDIGVGYRTQAPQPEDVIEGVEQRFNEFFDSLFFGAFKSALETAVASVRFPGNK